ncbi:DNA translocase FtsK [Moorella mulderi DSM 14980]|uniref:DNA translocase FtsK n=1 Tax=Moorella mulderi DSM 14980 TaxID=1122241 RepID=A0A151ASD7_9FIRM|nr:DNA translocase FtsK [Moorella mulderi DSM 14980]
MHEAKCDKIQEYNRRHPDDKLYPLIVIVDEFADLADQLGRNSAARKAFYDNIRRIAQLGRSRGIHLVLCTQRPSADLVPTNIRSLMNCRVALRVNDATASRMILEEPGAEQLQLMGDLLFKDLDTLYRAQGYYVEPKDVVEFLRGVQ